MRTLITGIGQIVSGDIDAPLPDGDSIAIVDGRIEAVGRGLDTDDADTVIDAKGSTVLPGLIDSHAHPTLGDFTPRQRTIDFIESSLHGGVTTMISAGEPHVPGRPKDVVGLKALAISAQRMFAAFRPGGVKVHAGAPVIECEMVEDDFKEFAAAIRQGKPLVSKKFSRPGHGSRPVRPRQLRLHRAHDAGALFTQAAFVTAVPTVNLLVFLAAGQLDRPGIDDDDVIAGIDERGVDRLVLALEEACGQRRNPAEDLAFGIDDVPPAVRALRAGHERTHEKGILRGRVPTGDVPICPEEDLQPQTPMIRTVVGTVKLSTDLSISLVVIHPTMIR